MTDFDFMVKHRLDGISNAHVDYEGNLCVEYEEYFNMGGSQTREIEFSATELKMFLAVAEAQEARYEEYRNCGRLA